MEQVATIWRLMAACLVVWRLACLCRGEGRQARAGWMGDAAAGYERVIDVASCVVVWMSAQAMLWVVYGFAGVLLNWVMLCGVCRVLHRPEGSELPQLARVAMEQNEVCDGGRTCFAGEGELKSIHG